MKMKNFLSLCLAVVLVITGFSGCTKNDIVMPPSDEKLITERIETFLTAYNTGDMDAVLECLDAKSRNAFRAMLNLLGGLAGGAAGFNINLSDLFSLGVSMSSGDFMKLEVTDIRVTDRSNAIATTVMDLTGAETQTVYFEMVYENNGWYIHDMTDRKPSGPDRVPDSENSDHADDNGNGEPISRYEIVDCKAFVDGRAWVRYHEDKQTDDSYGFIDMQGNVLYSVPADKTEIWNIGKGSGIVQSQSGLTLIDKTGAVRMELDGMAEIKASGGGYAWIYQNKSTITSSVHLYGVVDHNGKWVSPLEDLQESGVYNDIRYVGDGFVGTYDGTFLYNGDRSVTIRLSDIWDCRNITFSNGIAFVPRSCHLDWEVGMTVEVTTVNASGETLVNTDRNITENCILYADGRVVRIGNWLPTLNYSLAFYNGIAVTSEKIDLEGGQYYQLTDYTKASPVTVELTAYPASQILNFVFNGNYGLVEIRGLDGEIYVTMIDVQGNELITPIKGRYIDEYILTSAGYLYYEENGVYHIVDPNNHVVETDIRYVSFDDSGEVGIGGDNDYYTPFYIVYYIKPNGEKLFDTLTVNC